MISEVAFALVITIMNLNDANGVGQNNHVFRVFWTNCHSMTLCYVLKRKKNIEIIGEIEDRYRNQKPGGRVVEDGCDKHYHGRSIQGEVRNWDSAQSYIMQRVKISAWASRQPDQRRRTIQHTTWSQQQHHVP